MNLGFFLAKVPGKEVKFMGFSPNERGQGLLEYALILVLVVVVIIVVLALIGPAVANMYNTVVHSI
jgi:pilus assembly protein Flp/PilA